jgi:amidase
MQRTRGSHDQIIDDASSRRARLSASSSRSRCRRAATLVALVASLALSLVPLASVASAFNYVTTNNAEQWGVNDAAPPDVDTASIRSTTSSALQGFGGIRVKVSTKTDPAWANGALMRGFGMSFEPPNHFSTTKSVELGGVQIARYLWINVAAPTSTIPANWAQFVDEFKNVTKKPIEVTVDFGGQTGSGTGTQASKVLATSAGTTKVEPSDSWAEIGVVNASGVATNGPSAVVFGTPAPFKAAMTGVSDFLNDQFALEAPESGHESNFRGYQNSFTLAPGQVVTLAHFVLVGTSESEATKGAQVSLVASEAKQLAEKPVFTNLTKPQLCTLANWEVASLTVAAFSPSECTGIPAPELPAPPPPNPETTISHYNVVGKSVEQEQADMESGKTTSVEITQAYLDRIAAYDRGQFGFNSYITVNKEALQEAREADETRAKLKKEPKGLTPMPLLGIPVTVKDLYETKDMPTTNGSLVFKGWEPHKDAFQVAKLREAGAVILGKASMEEYATSGYYSDSAYGQVWNAFDPSRSSIASSGGTAVAIATSLAAAGLGTETGDSLYGPASAAGLVSLRGTDGMASTSGVMPLTWLQDYPGSIARTVPDLAAMEDVTTGTDPNDPETAEANAHRPTDWRNYLSAKALKGKVLGYYKSAFVDPNGTTNVTSAEEAAFKYFEEAGATIKILSGPPPAPKTSEFEGGFGDRNYEGWLKWIEANPNSPYKDPREIIGSQLKAPYSRNAYGYTSTGPMTPQQIANWKLDRKEYKEDIAKYMEENGVDAVIYPGLLSGISLNDGNKSSFGRQDTPSGSSGAPTMIFPAGTEEHGNPIDLQLLGRAWSDPELLGYAYAFEKYANAAGHGYPQTDTAPKLKVASAGLGGGRGATPGGSPLAASLVAAALALMLALGLRYGRGRLRRRYSA